MNFFRLLRIQQWYKNLVIFIALFFSGNIFNQTDITLTIYGFLILCMTSSSNYIINDIIDRKQDRLHPHKKNRPIASGQISAGSGITIAAILIIISTLAAYLINTQFLFIVISLFLLTQLYTFGLKNIPVLDATLVSTNFSLRSVAGAILINVWISPYLIILTFMLAFYLVILKRKADIYLLRNKSQDHKKVLKYYKKTNLNIIIASLLTIISIVYIIYSITIKYDIYSILSIIITLYGLIYTTALLLKDKVKSINPQLLLSDLQFLSIIIIWIIINAVRLYGPG